MILRQFTLAFSTVFVALFLLCGHLPAHAQQSQTQTQVYQAGHIKVEDLWIRATPPGQTKINGAGYLTITNNDANPDKLLSVKADISDKTALHKTSVENGVLKMHPIHDMTIPAHGTIRFSPANYHVMFINLKKSLKQGDVVPAVLTFEKAGNVSVVFHVKRITHHAQPATPHHPASNP